MYFIQRKTFTVVVTCCCEHGNGHYKRYLQLGLFTRYHCDCDIFIATYVMCGTQCTCSHGVIVTTTLNPIYSALLTINKYVVAIVPCEQPFRFPRFETRPLLTLLYHKQLDTCNACNDSLVPVNIYVKITTAHPLLTFYKSILLCYGNCPLMFKTHSLLRPSLVKVYTLKV